MNILVAYYARLDRPGSLEVAYHNPSARDRIVREMESSMGVRFKFATAVSLAELLRRGVVGPKTAADWTKRCALRGAVRALGL
jgi:hypothetical protein